MDLPEPDSLVRLTPRPSLAARLLKGLAGLAALTGLSFFVRHLARRASATDAAGDNDNTRPTVELPPVASETGVYGADREGPLAKPATETATATPLTIQPSPLDKSFKP